MSSPFSLVPANSSRILAGFGNAAGSRKELERLLILQDIKYHIAELEQVHSNKVILIDQSNYNDFANYPADAMVTNCKQITLVIRTADCYPILFWDPESQIIGAAHSGREGTRKNIAQSTIDKMIELGANPALMQAAIGPGVSEKNYQVDEETWQNFCAATLLEQDYRQIDIRKVIQKQLIDSGIKKEHIHNLQICTFSNLDYCSYRRNKTKKRQLSFITLL